LTMSPVSWSAMHSVYRYESHPTFKTPHTASRKYSRMEAVKILSSGIIASGVLRYYLQPLPQLKWIQSYQAETQEHGCESRLVVWVSEQPDSNSRGNFDLVKRFDRPCCIIIGVSPLSAVFRLKEGVISPPRIDMHKRVYAYYILIAHHCLQLIAIGSDDAMARILLHRSEQAASYS
jgi:hypothetical protein